MADPVITPLGASALAKRWLVEVNTGTTAVPEWTIVRGVQDCKPTVDATTQDDSDYDSDGWKSSTKTAQTWGLELKVGRKIDTETDAYDEGVEALRGKGDKVGLSALAHVRWSEVHDGPRVEAYEGRGTVSYSEDGGGMDSLATATIKIDGSGARESITHPYPAAA